MRAEIAQAIEDADFGPGRECKWKCPEPTTQSPLSPFSPCSSCIAEHILALFAERVRGIEVENPLNESKKLQGDVPLHQTINDLWNQWEWAVERTRTALLKELEP